MALWNRNEPPVRGRTPEVDAATLSRVYRCIGDLSNGVPLCRCRACYGLFVPEPDGGMWSHDCDDLEAFNRLLLGDLSGEGE